MFVSTNISILEKKAKLNSTERNRRIKTTTLLANFCGEKTPTDNFPEWRLILLFFSSHPETGDERKGLTRCTFYIENCYCSPPNLAHHLRGGLRRERRGFNGRTTANSDGWEERELGRGALLRGSLGKCRMDVSSSQWGKTLCLTVDCICLSEALSLWAGTGRYIDMCLCMCVGRGVCVCDREDWWWDLPFFFPTAAAQRISRHPQGNITQVAFEQKSWILLMIC